MADTHVPEDDEDRLPWLETVEEDGEDGPSPWRVLGLVLIGLAILAAVIFGWWMWQRHETTGGNGALINAQEGDYKVKPTDSGGMKVAGEGDTRFDTSEGVVTNGSIDVNALPEAPVDGKKVQPSSKPEGKGSSRVVASVPATTSGSGKGGSTKAPSAKGVDTAGGAIVQLGSFPSRSGANAAWKRMSERFSYLAALGQSVEQAKVNDTTVYRLRVNAGSASAATELCNKLKVAGEACYIPRD
ncbi:hypothetical protein GCM10023219_06440 [Stakelama sediminis]|uniref:SPOR domain-containing protein n=1 Tax=Stakelama sediminis TaxID=463200 RepID=A0A840YUU9_9SPHN|nr:SPOR domain-containing protein [Stakelama sediminis]MBB5717362.1 hypothetical protein [Stakelama sediminis]